MLSLNVRDLQSFQAQADILHVGQVAASTSKVRLHVFDSRVHLLLGLGLLLRGFEGLGGLQTGLDFAGVDVVCHAVVVGEGVLVGLGDLVLAVQLLPGIVAQGLVHAVLEAATSLKDRIQIGAVVDRVFILVDRDELAALVALIGLGGQHVQVLVLEGVIIGEDGFCLFAVAGCVPELRHLLTHIQI